MKPRGKISKSTRRTVEERGEGREIEGKGEEKERVEEREGREKGRGESEGGRRGEEREEGRKKGRNEERKKGRRDERTLLTLSAVLDSTTRLAKSSRSGFEIGDEKLIKWESYKRSLKS